MQPETITGAPAVTAFDTLRWNARRHWARLRERIWHVEGNQETFARRELELAGCFGKDSDYGGMVGPAVMQMVRQFADEGHSGYSANLVLDIFKKVAAFQPLTPLTGADDEWTEYIPDHFQNKRCSHVFRDADGTYDSTGRVFREPSGACYTGRGSRVLVTFPYTPTIEYVNVDVDGNVL